MRKNAPRQAANTLPRKFEHPFNLDLNVSGTMQGPNPKAQADPGMGEIRRQLEYKRRWRHTTLTRTSRLFLSNKSRHSSQHPTAKPNRRIGD